MRIDSHHHFWNYDSAQYPWIQSDGLLAKDFLPNDLAALIQDANIDGVISVQARQSIDETNWLLQHAAENPFILGVVGWTPMRQPDAETILEQWSSNSKLKALRHVIQDEKDGYMDNDAMDRSLHLLTRYNYVFDLLVYARQIPEAIRLVDRQPLQAFVLDHIGKPEIVAKDFDRQWAADLAALAKRENVFCKFSGLVNEVRDPDWNRKLLTPYFDVAIEAFGPNRLMFGSDWPVCLLRSEYGDWVRTCEELSDRLSPEEQSAFWSDNARRIYRL